MANRKAHKAEDITAQGWKEPGSWMTVEVFLFGSTDVQTQGLTLAKQVLYHLSHATSQFCFR
jgi:hypothetical protein